jgi:exopolysaccharide biosynthesis WecB/TagA/CpsF family protein
MGARQIGRDQAGGSVVDLTRERLARRVAEVAAPAVPTDPAVDLAVHLARLHDRRDRAVSVSWLNHHSALAVLGRSADVLHRLTYLGVDGLLLRRILGGALPRTSADAVIPPLLARLDSPRVAIVGGMPESLPAARDAIARLLPAGGHVVGARDGYGGLPRGGDLDAWLAEIRPTVVLAGLGAPLQDEFVVEVARRLPTGLALTCGGFLDQIQRRNYYPTWAYPLKLNWLVRLVREPRRMWRRYTVEAVAALAARPVLRRHLLTVEALHRLHRLAPPTPGRRQGEIASAG